MLDGASRIDELFAEAARMEMPALGITDQGVMYGVVPFYRAAQRHGVKPIIGTELYVATRSRHDKNAREKGGNNHMTAVAESDESQRHPVKLIRVPHLQRYGYRAR